jgi:hypothetical protein
MTIPTGGSTPQKPKLNLAEALKQARDNRPEFKLFPAKIYAGDFTSFVSKLSQAGNQESEVSITITAAEDVEYVGKTVRDWLLLEGKGIWRLLQLLDVLGINIELVRKASDLRRLLSGLEIGFRLEHRLDPKGVMRARVAEYFNSGKEGQQAIIDEMNARLTPAAQTMAPPAPAPAPTPAPAPAEPPEEEPTPMPMSEHKTEAAKTVAALKARIQAAMGK